MNQNFLYQASAKEFIESEKTDYFCDKPLSYQALKNIYALPPKNVWEQGKKIRWGGCQTADGAYIKASGRFRNREHTLEEGVMMGGYEFNKALCPVIKDEVIYCGEYLEHYGHFLLESTTRLWYVVQNKKPTQKLVFVAQQNFQIAGNFKRFFELLGISLDDIILITRPTKLESAIIPESSSAMGSYYTKEFLIPFKKIQENIPAENVHQIYLSRSKYKVRFSLGEEQLENVFKQNGFTVIYPELLPLEKLIALFKGAEYIAGITGTAMHNALFCNEKTTLILLNRTSNFNPQQGLINQAMNLNSIYTDVSLNFLPVENFFWLGITKPFQQMCQHLHFSLEEIPKNTPNQAKLFFKLWVKELPKLKKVMTPEEFQKSAEIACNLFSQMTNPSRLHQKMDLLKYGILSRISWGAHKKKYQTKLHHYQEQYGVIKK